MIEYIRLLRNIGQFDSVSTGARILLKPLTLIYAENGRGKTTLAAVLRSLRSGDPVPIAERHRLAASHAPHVILGIGGNEPAIFQNGSWSRTLPEIAVFDDLFVADNVCSGVDVDTEHRQNLHELILGAQGVTLNRTLERHAAEIDAHNHALRTKRDAIPAAARGTLTVDAFCSLEKHAHIDVTIQEAERALAAARAGDAVRQGPVFDVFALPEFDVAGIEDLLRRGLPELEVEAAARVQAHLASLGAGGESWVGDGMRRIASASAGRDHAVCPFCMQDLRGSELIAHYRAYFSSTYADMKQAIGMTLASVQTAHGGEVPAAFERAVRVAIQRREFWIKFTDVPEIQLDTAAIARAWKAALEPIVAILRAKQAAPLEQRRLPAEVIVAVAAYDKLRAIVAALSASLRAANAQLAMVKERTASANLATLEADLARMMATRARFSAEVAPLCDSYLAEKAAKAKTEELRDQARAALDEYRQNIFPAYETAINAYLTRFNAGFRLTRVHSVNTRGGSTCTYNVLINNVAVPITPGSAAGPSFRNTMSSGDRNTLALAFFFASLDRDPQRRQKIVVIDDPITSLDEHRSLTTVQEMRELLAAVGQVIVLSHSKPFLCALWEGADTDTRASIKIVREQTGSTLADWDVNQDCITEHDRRYALVRSYMHASTAADVRAVAAALRPMLESFMRVAYSDCFPPGSLLGPFLGICEQRKGTSGQILAERNITELRALLDYANKFYHDTNPAWETASINDGELLNFCHRNLAFMGHR